MEDLRNNNYFALLQDIKDKIKSAQLKAVVSVNKELIRLYWDIGKRIVEEQAKSKWGDNFIENLSSDLSKEFPDLKGVSKTNLKNMKQWYLFYRKSDVISQQLVGQLPWGHNILIINKTKDLNEAIFYLQESIKNNWSRSILLHQIESEAHKRKGKSINNFEISLPKIQSDLANETIKDPYVFDFLTLSDKYQEKDLENQLTDHITKFLLELGSGFAYVGKQYPLEVSGKDYYIDLLFYHLKLKSFVIIELKSKEFKPEYVGKLNFYLSAIDDKLKQNTDNPSIGIILCKNKDKITAEYALKDLTKPIGISEYKLAKAIPKNLKPNLPTIEEIEKELSK